MAERLKSHGWRELTFNAHGQSAVHALLASGAKVYEKGGNRVIVSQEDRDANGRMLWHLSISRNDRYPGWDEIKDARYALLPLGLTFAMILPPPNEYVNVHPNCFHLWEIRDAQQIPPR